MSEIALDVLERPRRSGELTTFLGALAVSKIGDALYLFALPWIAYELTRSAAVMGMLYALEIVPVVLFGAMAGVWVDRYGMRRAMVVSDVARAVLVGSIPLLHALNVLRLGHLVAIAPALGLLTLVFDVATTAAIPGLATSSLTRANAAHQSTNQLAAMLGPLFAGVVIQIIGGFNALAIDAVTFSATILVVGMWGRASASPTSKPASTLLADGIRWLRGNAVVRTLALQAAIGNFGFGMVSAVMMFYLRDTLRAPAAIAGAAYAIIGVGGLAGSGAIVPLAQRARAGVLYPLILAVGFIGYMIALTPTWAGAAFGLALVAACNISWVTLSTSVRQTLIPAPLFGRVLAASRVLSVGAMPVGAAVGGWIASAGAVHSVFLVAALTKLIEIHIALRSEMRRL